MQIKWILKGQVCITSSNFTSSHYSSRTAQIAQVHGNFQSLTPTPPSIHLHANATDVIQDTTILSFSYVASFSLQKFGARFPCSIQVIKYIRLRTSWNICFAAEPRTINFFSIFPLQQHFCLEYLYHLFPCQFLHFAFHLYPNAFEQTRKEYLRKKKFDGTWIGWKSQHSFLAWFLCVWVWCESERAINQYNCFVYQLPTHRVSCSPGVYMSIFTIFYFCLHDNSDDAANTLTHSQQYTKVVQNANAYGVIRCHAQLPFGHQKSRCRLDMQTHSAFVRLKKKHLISEKFQ